MLLDAPVIVIDECPELPEVPVIVVDDSPELAVAPVETIVECPELPDALVINTDGSSFHNGKDDAMAGIGVFFGKQDQR